jgi:hypothetical protein
MEENTKNEQQLDEEQLQDVTGGLFGGLFGGGRNSQATTLNQINNHQTSATGLFQQAAIHRARGNNTYADMLERNANGHLGEINNLNSKINRR